MASVNVTGIVVLNNPASFVDPFQFEITFECVKELQEDLEWRLTYVGSAESESCDQELDSVLVGPVPMGVNRFVFEAPAPDPTKIPKQDLIGVTVCLVSCLYRGKEFIRIGYYVNNEYDDPETGILLNGEEGLDIDESEGEEEGEGEGEGEEEEDDEEELEAGEGQGDGSVGATEDKAGEPSQDKDDKSSEEQNGHVTSSNKREQESESTQDKKKLKTEDTKEEAEKVEATTDEEQVEATKTDKPPEKQEPFQLPDNFSIEKIRRSILYEKPRITRFMIDWDDK
mmetsp:Transcript_17396/g.28068  ORF Transcript_17396/g.28068 Transcript_17396/m.28068 type:complete len:284 (+) Transcript_17396:85-936(+)